MTPAAIRFCCPHCRARIKAAAPLAGHGRDCPACGRALRVPRPVREDSGPILVLWEGPQEGSWRAAYRRSA
jgi:hypothetical protein